MNRPLTLTKGCYTARFARTDEDLRAAQGLRYLSFRTRTGRETGSDCDAFDSLCRHVLIEERESDQIVCCYRLLGLNSGAEINRSYSAQFYDLSALAGFDRPMIEMGRFCVHPQWNDPDVLRLAWGAMTTLVDQEGVELLFGCSSFPGTEPDRYLDAFALLKDRHLAPDHWRPGKRAPHVYDFAQHLTSAPDMKRAQTTMPPLLRTYLLMGGWVSDHAVVDYDLGTLHVFTGVEVRAVPPGRAKLLRAMAG